MPFEVVMPRLGWTMEKGSLGSWLKHDGDRVEVGEVIFTVEGDKATQEVEALESGILRIPEDSPLPGVEVPVGTLLAYILQPGESLPLQPQFGEHVTPSGSDGQLPVFRAANEVSRVGEQERVQSTAPRNRISPRARRVAGELGVDWTALRGSGRTGRIVERDVRQAAETARTEATPAVAFARAGLTTEPAGARRRDSCSRPQGGLSRSPCRSRPSGAP